MFFWANQNSEKKYPSLILVLSISKLLLPERVYLIMYVRCLSNCLWKKRICHSAKKLCLLQTFISDKLVPKSCPLNFSIFVLVYSIYIYIHTTRKHMLAFLSSSVSLSAFFIQVPFLYLIICFLCCVIHNLLVGFRNYGPIIQWGRSIRVSSSILFVSYWLHASGETLTLADGFWVLLKCCLCLWTGFWEALFGNESWIT